MDTIEVVIFLGGFSLRWLICKRVQYDVGRKKWASKTSLLPYQQLMITFEQVFGIPISN